MIDAETDPDAWDPVPTPEPLPLWQRIGGWGWFGLALATLVVVAVAQFLVRRHSQIEGLSVTERVYEDLVNWVRRLLRVEAQVHLTPHEYAGAVVQQMPTGREAVERIAGLYVEERFGGKAVPGEQAEAAWRRAWPALWRSWLERRVMRLRRFWWRFVPPKELSEP